MFLEAARQPSLKGPTLAHAAHSLTSDLRTNYTVVQYVFCIILHVRMLDSCLHCICWLSCVFEVVLYDSIIM